MIRTCTLRCSSHHSRLHTFTLNNKKNKVTSERNHWKREKKYNWYSPSADDRSAWFPNTNQKHAQSIYSHQCLKSHNLNAQHVEICRQSPVKNPTSSESLSTSSSSLSSVRQPSKTKETKTEVKANNSNNFRLIQKSPFDWFKHQISPVKDQSVIFFSGIFFSFSFLIPLYRHHHHH